MGSDSAATSGYPWAAAIALAIPAFGLAGAGGFLGVSTPIGAGLVGAGAVYLLLDLFVIQPKLAAGAGGGGPDAASQEFLERALAFDSVESVAREFDRTVSSAIGPSRAVLLAPSPDGKVRVLSAAGPEPMDLGDPTPAFLWLGDRAEPLYRDELQQLEQFEGARAAAQLMDKLGCDVLLPLLHRGLLLGLGLVARSPQAKTRDLYGFFAGMRAYMTVAVANTFLDAEAQMRSRLTKTFDLATAMQESLMPDERPSRRAKFEVRGMFRPVAECGGDLWAWRELADGKVLLVIADATGHGAAPALLAAVAKGAIDAHWQMSLTDLDPANLLSALNKSIHRTGRKRYLMTAFAAVVDTANATLYYANAGQNFPYLIHAQQRERGRVEPLIARGNSLGAAAEAHFETHERPINTGDKLFLYTDGIIDAGSPMIEPFGEKRFRAALAANIDKRAIRLPDIIMAEVESYIGNREMMDDITMVSFGFGAEEDR